MCEARCTVKWPVGAAYRPENEIKAVHVMATATFKSTTVKFLLAIIDSNGQKEELKD